MPEDVWRTIPNFPGYWISKTGEVYNTTRYFVMRTSRNNFGHTKISLVDAKGDRRTMSVAVLVAEAFVDPPHPICDQVILLDGDLSNVHADNLAWRPRWFAWKYAHQLRNQQPTHYINLPLLDTVHDKEHKSVIEAGMKEGLLFDDIWRSTYRGDEVYPTGCIFQVLDRV